jgi:phospholipase/carboxylesterase
MRTLSLGGLRVRLTGGDDREGGGEGPAVVLLHGFGAPGNDLVSLSRVIDAPQGTRFVFPEAPLALPGGGEGRAWWMLDVDRLQRAILSGEDRDPTEVPEGLVEGRALVDAMLDDLDRSLRPSKIVLGGFSQGAMLSCDVALSTDRPLAGLVMLSGTLIAEARWRPLMPSRRGLPVFQSHGVSDGLLPYALSERLRDALQGAGLSVTWCAFRGGHEIPGSVVDALGPFLRAALG